MTEDKSFNPRKGIQFRTPLPKKYRIINGIYQATRIGLLVALAYGTFQLSRVLPNGVRAWEQALVAPYKEQIGLFESQIEGLYVELGKEHTENTQLREHLDNSRVASQRLESMLLSAKRAELDPIELGDIEPDPKDDPGVITLRIIPPKAQPKQPDPKIFTFPEGYFKIHPDFGELKLSKEASGKPYIRFKAQGIDFDGVSARETFLYNMRREFKESYTSFQSWSKDFSKVLSDVTERKDPTANNGGNALHNYRNKLKTAALGEVGFTFLESVPNNNLENVKGLYKLWEELGKNFTDIRTNVEDVLFKHHQHYIKIVDDWEQKAPQFKDQFEGVRKRLKEDYGGQLAHSASVFDQLELGEKHSAEERALRATSFFQLADKDVDYKKIRDQYLSADGTMAERRKAVSKGINFYHNHNFPNTKLEIEKTILSEIHTQQTAVLDEVEKELKKDVESLSSYFRESYKRESTVDRHERKAIKEVGKTYDQLIKADPERQDGYETLRSYQLKLVSIIAAEKRLTVPKK